MVTRGDVWLTVLDPTIGGEIKKTRPCVIVSPPEINAHLKTVIAAPMPTGNRPAPIRVSVRFQRRDGLIPLDQMRALDKSRPVRRLGVISPATLTTVLEVLAKIFAL